MATSAKVECVPLQTSDIDNSSTSSTSATSSKTKVLMVYPEFPDTFWSFKHALKFVRKRSAFPPLGLLTVAAMLPEAWDVTLVDLNIERLSDKQLLEADLVFLSAMTVQQASARQVIARCHALGVKTVAGGPLFTSEPENFPEVDHFVLNEAECTLPPFVADYEAGEAKASYTSDEHPDITQTPLPRWDLVNMKRYGSMCIQYSRGCPFNCDFCNVTALFGRKPRLKTNEQIVAELDALHERGWNGSMFFVDDNFIGHKKRVKELLPAIIEWRNRTNSKMVFNTEASINLADEEELTELMVEAGFDTVFVGIETPDEAGLLECSKQQNTKRDLVACVHKLHNAGLQVQAGFIVGFDSDGPDIFGRQLEFIQRSGIVTAMVGMLQAPIGTRLFQRMSVEGRLLGLCDGDNVDGSTNIMPTMGLDTLKDGYRKLIDELYSPKVYYKRVRTFLDTYNPPKVRAKMNFNKLAAFCRACFHLGVLGKERLQYWKLMAWTLLRKPSSLPYAVTLAIYGRHFRKMCELHVS